MVTGYLCDSVRGTVWFRVLWFRVLWFRGGGFGLGGEETWDGHSLLLSARFTVFNVEVVTENNDQFTSW